MAFLAFKKILYSIAFFGNIWYTGSNCEGEGGAAMMTQVKSLGLHGVEGYEVMCECDLSGGLPNFDIVGLPDAAVREARDRVRSGVK